MLNSGYEMKQVLRRPSADPSSHLIPTLLIAATINEDGNIDLPAVENGVVEPETRVEFYPGSEGEMYQRRYRVAASRPCRSAVADRRGAEEPLNMVFFAECLTHTFGELTPCLFRLEKREASATRQFILGDEDSDRERLRVIHDAFNIYLIAYEECLV